MDQAPAGWHPDPRGRHELRYWDGAAWTDHVSDAGQVSRDPVSRTLWANPEEPPPEEPPRPRPAAEPEAESEPEPEPDAVPPAEASPPAAERDPALAALLDIVAPGTGHFYAGRPGATALALATVTLVAMILAYLGFGLFVAGLALWIGAAAYAVGDLPGGLAALRAGRMPRPLAGWVLVAAGAGLFVSLVLPYYHVAVTVHGFGGASGTASGFEAFGLTDLLLVAVAAAAVLAGLGALGRMRAADALPAAAMVAGLIGCGLVAFRMFVRPGLVVDTGGFSGVDVSVGRGPGILLAMACCLAIAGAASALVARGPVDRPRAGVPPSG